MALKRPKLHAGLEGCARRFRGSAKGGTSAALGVSVARHMRTGESSQQKERRIGCALSAARRPGMRGYTHTNKHKHTHIYIHDVRHMTHILHCPHVLVKRALWALAAFAACCWMIWSRHLTILFCLSLASGKAYRPAGCCTFFGRSRSYWRFSVLFACTNRRVCLVLKPSFL